MKCVPALMQQRLDIALLADRIHENERPPGLVERGLIAAGCLAFPVVEVKQPFVAHHLELGAEPGINTIKNLLRARDELLDLLERAQRWPVQWIDGQIPRAQGRHIELPATLRLELTHDGHDDSLDRVVKLPAVSKRVVK